MSEPYTIGKLTRTRADGTRYWSYCLIARNPHGTRTRISLGTTDLQTARADARARWEASRLQERGFGTIGDIVETYLDSLNGEKQEGRKRECWAACKRYWADLRPDLIDAKVSKDYLAWRNRAINTMRHELSLIRTACNWAVGERHIPAAPPIKLPAMPETSVGHVTKDEFRRFLDGCATPHIKLFAMLGVTTGGRKTALLEAKWEQVDFTRRILNLNPEGRRQNSKYRATVPLNDVIMPALCEAHLGRTTEYIIEHNGAPCKDIKKGFAAAARRSGVSLHPHMLRHTAAVWMAEDRVPMAEIASYLGHRDINVTVRVYARYHPDYLREAARSLTW
ncbi:tyrosine-type recombinase/integrase [Aurantiacibacter hainanensis]|uniref:tyrosine-type recombinase/integrase n=1 Tax=Aurantiacibacter hainanensis TaxID=3076114 RepID=UPI0030C6B091